MVKSKNNMNVNLIKPNLYCSDPRFLMLNDFVYALPRFADNSYITFFCCHKALHGWHGWYLARLKLIYWKVRHLATLSLNRWIGSSMSRIELTAEIYCKDKTKSEKRFQTLRFQRFLAAASGLSRSKSGNPLSTPQVQLPHLMYHSTGTLRRLLGP